VPGIRWRTRKGWFAVTLRKLLLLPVAALLGAALVVLPALAASSEVKLEVNENCVESNWPCWATPGSGSKPPPASSVTIASGGVVAFADNSSTPANIAWIGSAPVCSAGVPVSPAPAASKWEGTCTFEAPGTYKYESSTLYFAYTKYEVIVTGAATTGTTPAGTGTTSTPSSTTGGGSSTSHGSSTYTSTSSTPGAGGSGGGTSAGSLLVGGASSAIKLSGLQRGRSVHGSVDISREAAGGKLEVQLLAARASIADAGHSSRVQVGRVARSALHAGAVSFVVPLDSRARRALGAHGHLGLRVKLVLTPLRGSPVTITRNVTVRA